MANYRFKAAEIEAMKKNILTHIEREAETKTAWRLRCAIEGLLMCCRPSKREAARLERELALYEKLTKNDLPNWQSNPTQSAQATETPRIVRVEIVRDFDKSYYANLYDENGGGHNLSKEYTDFRTLKTLCKKEYGVNLPNLSQIEFETHGRKSYAYISTEMPRISTETAETVNVSENEPQAAKYKPYTTRAEIIALLESEHGIEYDAGEVVYLKDGCVAEDLSDEGEWRIYLDADSDKCIDVIAIQPPQSPKPPQTAECTTEIPKPRETARKRQNRAIGSTHHQHSALGANGYAMLDDASATMAAMNVRQDTLRDTLRPVTYVPRECSTIDAAYW